MKKVINILNHLIDSLPDGHNGRTHIEAAIRELSRSGVSFIADEGGHVRLSEQSKAGDLFFAAIEMTRMPMIVTNPNQPDNPIVFANQAFFNTCGYDTNEVIGRNCRFMQGADTDPEAVLAIRRALANKTDISIEIKNYRKDGTAFWNALFISPIFDHEGKLLYFFGSQLDVTRRREAESALRKSQKMEALGQLTGGIAHDFNNLLQIILGNLQIARYTNDWEKATRHLELIDQAARKARDLTQQLLAFSRKQPLEARTVNLNRIVVDMREMLSRTLGQNIEIVTHLYKELDNAYLDTVQLEMALLNILVNARDAMPKGGAVTISTRNVNIMANEEDGDLLAGQYVEISIRDEGIGMTSDILAHITEPFFSTKEVGKGTGLGMAQVYGFVKQSRGCLRVYSTVGQGTEVRMLFPAKREPLSADRISVPLGLKQDGNGERILIVEDNHEVQQLARTILESVGYQTATADCARTALHILAEGGSGIDLLFSDVIMPGQMNGISLAKEVRRHHPGMPVLMTTGFSDEMHGHTNSTEFETIYKPYMPDELTRKIRAILNRRHDHRT